MSRVSIRIRPAEHADIDGLVALIGAADPKSGVFSGRPMHSDADHLAVRLSEILLEDERTLLVAVDDSTGDTVGLLVAKVDEIGAIDLTPVLHVTHLLVTPKQRRRGIGRALLAGAVHLADERGMDRVMATVASGSREANRYLARLGFAPLVVHRIASTAAIRRTLGLADTPERMAVLRRARLMRAHRAGVTTRAIKGA